MSLLAASSPSEDTESPDVSLFTSTDPKTQRGTIRSITAYSRHRVHSRNLRSDAIQRSCDWFGNV
jgi:hypothetical protein